MGNDPPHPCGQLLSLGQVMAVLMGGVKAKLNSRGNRLETHAGSSLGPRLKQEEGPGSQPQEPLPIPSALMPMTLTARRQADFVSCQLGWIVGGCREGWAQKGGQAQQGETQPVGRVTQTRAVARSPSLEDVFPAGSASRPAEAHPSLRATAP